MKCCLKNPLMETALIGLRPVARSTWRWLCALLTNLGRTIRMLKTPRSFNMQLRQKSTINIRPLHLTSFIMILTRRLILNTLVLQLWEMQLLVLWKVITSHLKKFIKLLNLTRRTPVEKIVDHLRYLPQT